MPSQDDAPTELLLAVGSGNFHKVEEIAAALSGIAGPRGLKIRVLGKSAFPPGPEPLETGATFAENAQIKALSYAGLAAQLPPEKRPFWVLADDSGLSVDALGGAPGVRSARYAGENATDGDNNALLLRNLAQVPQPERGAEFVCSLCLVLVSPKADQPHTVVLEAEGRCRGMILPAQRGSGGFGYDPLFLVPSLGKTFAELSTDEKNALSHRGRALQALRERLPQVLAKLQENP